MFERFTERARQVVVESQAASRELRHGYIGTEHLLLGMLRVEEGVAAIVLTDLGLDYIETVEQIKRTVNLGQEVPRGEIPLTPRAKRALEFALREALSLGHNYIGTEHLLLGLVRENEGVGVRILTDLNVDLTQIRDGVISSLAGPGSRRFPSQEPVRLEMPDWQAAAYSEWVARVDGKLCLPSDHVLNDVLVALVPGGVVLPQQTAEKFIKWISKNCKLTEDHPAHLLYESLQSAMSSRAA